MPLKSVKIRPPLPKPATIDCMAVNYMEDGTRSAPAPINAFHKCPSAIVGDGDTMVLPDVPAPIFEGEAEMAVVIGKKAANVSEDEATDTSSATRTSSTARRAACRRRATCSSR